MAVTVFLLSALLTAGIAQKVTHEICTAFRCSDDVVASSDCSYWVNSDPA